MNFVDPTRALNLPGRLSAFLARAKSTVSRSEWRLVGMVLAIKVIVLFFGVQAYHAVANRWLDSWRGIFEIWTQWDAKGYLEVAAQGYRIAGDSRYRLVLFPLYPFTVRCVAFITRDVSLSAFVVSLFGTIAAALFLYRLVSLDQRKTIAQRAVWFLMIFPTSFFLHIAYTESLFLAAALGCFLAARTDRWAWAGVFGAIACSARINGMLLVPALAVEALQQYYSGRGWRARYLWILVVPAGFAVFLAINYYVSGDPFLFLTLEQTNWFKSHAWPWNGVMDRLSYITLNPPRDAAMTGMEESIFIGLGLAMTIWSWFTLRLCYSVWMTLNWLLYVSVGFVLCVPRYTLILFPIYILFARAARRPIWNVIITVWSILFLGLFIILFVNGDWVS